MLSIKLLRFKCTYLSLGRHGMAMFCGSKTGDFNQTPPELGNQYQQDPLLDSYLKSVLPVEVYEEVHPDLSNFGDIVSKEVLGYHTDVGNYEPILQQYNAWGERIDTIHTHPSWRMLHGVASKEQLISLPYTNKYGIWSRTIQAAKLFLFSPSSGLYSCPLAMTDGAASILKFQKDEPFVTAFSRLTSNDSDLFWTSGQWMTEKRGGSDVGNATDTRAVKQADGTYRLYGFKWFTSATDANISLTLGRIQDEDGNIKEGTRGLTMFYLETRNTNGSLNGIKIEKLKKKLGTRQMPTAEMILDGAKAYKVSDAGRGIASIAPMLTITRIHNAISAVSAMRRLLNLSKDFAKKRTAFGSYLCDNPLHIQTLARLEVEQRGGFHLLMKVCHLLGLKENGRADDSDEMLLRILTPLLKLYTGKQAVSVCSELLESFGGHGYLEDTGLPTYLRDAQVLSIWEGTTNILSMDVLRSIHTTNGKVVRVFLSSCSNNLTDEPSNLTELNDCRKVIMQAITDIKTFIDQLSFMDEIFMQSAARDFSYSLARTYVASLLYNHARNSSDVTSKQTAIMWVNQNELSPIRRSFENGNCYSRLDFQHNRSIVYGNA